jgi:hypothetical protein
MYIYSCVGYPQHQQAGKAIPYKTKTTGIGYKHIIHSIGGCQESSLVFHLFVGAFWCKCGFSHEKNTVENTVLGKRQAPVSKPSLACQHSSRPSYPTFFYILVIKLFSNLVHNTKSPFLLAYEFN